MFGRENWIGLALLALCGIAGGVLVWSLVTGTILTYQGPEWLPWVLLVVWAGAVLYMLFRMPKTWL